MLVKLTAADNSASVVVDLPLPLPRVVISEQRAFVLDIWTDVYEESTVRFQPPLLRDGKGQRLSEVPNASS